MKKLQKLWCAAALAAMGTFFFGGFHDVIVSANNTPQTLPFTQDWSNTGLITTNDDWAAVPGIIGYLGDISAASTTAVDPRTLLLDYATLSAVDVIANQTNPDTLTNGGVAEFQITNPVVALNGSGTADAPHIIIHLNTTGQSNIRFTANIRDIDGSADDSIQQIDIQYRIGGTGNYISVPGGYFADVTAPGTATTVTPVDVTLPASANNQTLVQVRVMTTNAVGNDEWVGIDDISFTAGGPVVAADAPNDINGDGKTDYIVIRNLGGQGRWFFAPNGTGGPTQAVDWGISGDRAVMQDFDGDDKDDVTVWRSADVGGSKFYILNSATSTARVEQFGVPGDNPTVVGDYDGDGKADLAVYRNVSGPAPQQNFWFYRGSSNNPSGNVSYVPWGTSGDSVSPGDYDGDGKFDFVVRRPTGSGTGNFWILFANGTIAPVIYFGENNDLLVPGDYDGDGKFDVATVSSSNGAYQWRYLSSLNGSINYRIFGVAPFDVLVPGDYDGDGKMDPAIFRTSLDPNNVNFWSLNSSNGAVQVYEFGQEGDFAVANWNVH
jgi:hypothetical protein